MNGESVALETKTVASADLIVSVPEGSRRFPLFEIIAGLLCAAYAYLFWHDISAYWFNPNWTTDDAMQQSFPFYKALYPDLYKGDLITKMMECYLEPLHYGISYAITLMTKNPIMTGHWVTLIQIAATCAFMFAAVRKMAGVVPAFFATAWFLHTRLVVQRITGGLPRGWAAPIFAAYFYCELAGQENAMLLVILIGCMLHAPATLVIALSHGLFLVWRTLASETRAQFKPRLVRYIILSPFFAALTLYMVRMPSYIGSMATLDVASKMPEFQNPGGRFPFLPVPPFWISLKSYGFDPFLSRLHRSGPFLANCMPAIVAVLAMVIYFVGYKKKRVTIPTAFLCFIAATFGVYFLSIVLAFRLYVPNRHLQFPLALCEIALFSIGTWRACAFEPLENKNAHLKFYKRHNVLGVVTLVFLGIFIYLGSGDGLEGSANFNWDRGKHGGAFEWIRHNTPMTAVIAGEPSFMDPVQLFGMRIGYVTTETAHPFYDHYYAEMSRRLGIALHAHYARSLKELSDELAPEGIDYFVFDRSKFTPTGLEAATYYKPFDIQVRGDIASNGTQFAFYELKMDAGSKRFAPIVYQDHQAIVVDLHKLREFLETKS